MLVNYSDEDEHGLEDSFGASSRVESLANLVNSEQKRREAKEQALAAGRSSSVQPRAGTDKIGALDVQKQRETVIEDYDEDVSTPLNRKS